MARPPVPLIAFAAMIAASAAAACSSSPGTVNGDAYIVTETGSQVSFGGLPIRIIPESVAIDTLLAQVCPRPRYGGRAVLDTAAQALAWQRRARVLSARVSRTVVTDAGAHYVVDSIPPGKYRLWADTAYGGTRWSWLGAGDDPVRRQHPPEPLQRQSGREPLPLPRPSRDLRQRTGLGEMCRVGGPESPRPGFP